MSKRQLAHEMANTGKQFGPCYTAWNAPRIRWTACAIALVAACIVVIPATAAPPSPTALRSTFQQAVRTFDEAQEIHDARPDVARQLFLAAAQQFQSIVSAGIVNGQLEFNLGNCYLQAGDVGHAILHYRRARRLIPRDPLLADNLSVARDRCLTTVRPAAGNAFLRAVLFVHFDTSTASRSRAALAAYVSFWLMLIIRLFVRSRAAGVLALMAGGIAVTLCVSVATDAWTDRNVPAGVVIGMDVPVSKGPSTGYQRLYEQPLQPGTEFVLRESRGGWSRIELADGNAGWVESAQTTLIPRAAP